MSRALELQLSDTWVDFSGWWRGRFLMVPPVFIHMGIQLMENIVYIVYKCTVIYIYIHIIHIIIYIYILYTIYIIYYIICIYILYYIILYYILYYYIILYYIILYYMTLYYIILYYIIYFIYNIILYIYIIYIPLYNGTSMEYSWTINGTWMGSNCDLNGMMAIWMNNNDLITA